MGTAARSSSWFRESETTTLSDRWVVLSIGRRRFAGFLGAGFSGRHAFLDGLAETPGETGRSKNGEPERSVRDQASFPRSRAVWLEQLLIGIHLCIHLCDPFSGGNV